MKDRYDYLVIGSGPAGYTSAIRASQLGKKVAVVEKNADMLGGVCLNEGCIPAKSLFNSARIFDLARRNLDICSVEIKEKKANLALFSERSREIAKTLRGGVSFLFKKNGIDLITGSAQFIDSETLEVKSSDKDIFKISAEKVLIATGSSPKALTEMPFDGKHILTSSDILRLKEVPGKVLVVGGGAIGTEFASFFSLIGSEVTIAEAEDRLLPFEDKEVSKRLESIFRKKNIKVLTSSQVDSKKAKEYDTVLVSIGRSPNTSGLALAKAGVEVDGEGFIFASVNMRTSTENIYAAGDVVNTPMLAHVASAEGEIAAEAASGKMPEPVDYSLVPNAVYTEVQVASLGITEEEASSKGANFAAGKQFFKSCGKAVLSSETEGFIKVIADKDSRKLLGVHIVGHEATELIHEFVIAKKAGLTTGEIAKAVHAHPTLSETAVDACRAVFDKPIHG